MCPIIRKLSSGDTMLQSRAYMNDEMGAHYLRQIHLLNFLLIIERFAVLCLAIPFGAGLRITHILIQLNAYRCCTNRDEAVRVETSQIHFTKKLCLRSRLAAVGQGSWKPRPLDSIFQRNMKLHRYQYSLLGSKGTHFASRS